MENVSSWKETAFYGEKACVLVEGGVLYFDPDSRKEVVGAENMTYDEYLDTQVRSLGKYRTYFAMCYDNVSVQFKGQIEKITKRNICFRRIFVEGMYMDGMCFDGKEDHVWMDKAGFAGFQVGDCAAFYAEVYRYVKTGSGKMIDYGLRKPEDIQKIAAYDLPSDEALRMQAIDQIICETCLFSEHCNGLFCLRNEEELRQLRQTMLDAMG